MSTIRLTPALLAEITASLEPNKGDRDALGRLHTLLANQRRERDGSVRIAPAPELEDALMGTLDYLLDKWTCSLPYVYGIGNQRRLERFMEQASDLLRARTHRIDA